MLPGAGCTAHASPNLAKARNCMNCHGLDCKIVGPAIKDLALRYACKSGAAEMLAAMIVKDVGGA